MYCLILAGGAGTRFWPSSRGNRPKQLLELVNGKSLLQQTYQRLAKYDGCESILTVASAQLSASIREQLPEITEQHQIIEPMGRNTAPAIALAALILRKRYGNVMMGVFPADHLISNDKHFFKALDAAAMKAGEGDNLVTIGIQPNYPATGYGYVEFDRQPKGDIHPVTAFTEKPDLEKAETFLEEGRHLWNGGMFIWAVETILAKFKDLLPATFNALATLEELIDTPDFYPALEAAWAEVDAISIDFGILEHSNSIFTVEARFEWRDLGSWKSMYDLSPKDKNGNVAQGDIALIDTTNSLVVSKDHFTAVIGVDNLTVIHTGDATIVVPTGQSERVSEVVRWLQTRDRKELL